MGNFKINFDNSFLVFSMTEKGWCRVNRVYADESVYLGTDAWEIIQERLLKCITTPCISEEPEWVLSLFEGHYSLYRKKNNESIELMWQHPDAEFISSDIISESQRDNFMKLLSESPRDYVSELLNEEKVLSKTEIKKLLKIYFSIENIDRKLVVFTDNSKFQKPGDSTIYASPELIIIKNKYGKIIFNLIMAHIQKQNGGYKEKGTSSIEDNAEFPYFVIEMEMIDCGMRMGYWEHYGNDTSKLSNEISLDKQRDDFANFKNDMERMLGV